MFFLIHVIKPVTLLDFGFLGNFWHDFLYLCQKSSWAGESREMHNVPRSSWASVRWPQGKLVDEAFPFSETLGLLGVLTAAVQHTDVFRDTLSSSMRRKDPAPPQRAGCSAFRGWISGMGKRKYSGLRNLVGNPTTTRTAVIKNQECEQRVLDKVICWTILKSIKFQLTGNTPVSTYVHTVLLNICLAQFSKLKLLIILWRIPSKEKKSQNHVKNLNKDGRHDIIYDCKKLGTFYTFIQWIHKMQMMFMKIL